MLYLNIILCDQNAFFLSKFQCFSLIQNILIIKFTFDTPLSDDNCVRPLVRNKQEKKDSYVSFVCPRWGKSLKYSKRRDGRMGN